MLDIVMRAEYLVRALLHHCKLFVYIVIFAVDFLVIYFYVILHREVFIKVILR